MGYFTVFFGVKERLRDGAQGKRGKVVIEALKTFPLFVFGFFLVVFINTVANVPGWLAGPLATWPVTTFPTTVSSVLLMLAIIGICARVNRSALKIAGVKALILGLITWVTQSIVVLVVAFFLLH